jgi:YfiH family protein
MGSSNGIITPALARATGVRAGFTTRGAEGAVPVDERTAVFGLTQVHSARVVTVTVDDEPGAVAGVEADALVTSRPDACLTVRVADCVPVLVATPDGRAVAAVHAGWRGLAAGILAAAVGRLCALGRCEPADLRAAAGPAIGPCCYEVDLEVGRRIAASAAGGILGAPYGPGKV